MIITVGKNDDHGHMGGTHDWTCINLSHFCRDQAGAVFFRPPCPNISIIVRWGCVITNATILLAGQWRLWFFLGYTLLPSCCFSNEVNTRIYLFFNRLWNQFMSMWHPMTNTVNGHPTKRSTQWPQRSTQWSKRSTQWPKRSTQWPKRSTQWPKRSTQWPKRSMFTGVNFMFLYSYPRLSLHYYLHIKTYVNSPG